MTIKISLCAILVGTMILGGCGQATKQKQSQPSVVAAGLKPGEKLYKISGIGPARCVVTGSGGETVVLEQAPGELTIPAHMNKEPVICTGSTGQQMTFKLHQEFGDNSNIYTVTSPTQISVTHVY